MLMLTARRAARGDNRYGDTDSGGVFKAQGGSKAFAFHQWHFEVDQHHMFAAGRQGDAAAGGDCKAIGPRRHADDIVFGNAFVHFGGSGNITFYGDQPISLRGVVHYHEVDSAIAAGQW